MAHSDKNFSFDAAVQGAEQARQGVVKVGKAFIDNKNSDLASCDDLRSRAEGIVAAANAFNSISEKPSASKRLKKATKTAYQGLTKADKVAIGAMVAVPVVVAAVAFAAISFFALPIVATIATAAAFSIAATVASVAISSAIGYADVKKGERTGSRQDVGNAIAAHRERSDLNCAPGYTPQADAQSARKGLASLASGAAGMAARCKQVRDNTAAPKKPGE